jgi:hypothetical protein
MKVIIAGSREGFLYHDIEIATKDSYFTITQVVSGTARGVDTHGEAWANDNDINIIRFPADWDKHGKAAGHIRNREMGLYADALIALWDGKSKGTKGMIDFMLSLDKPVFFNVKE